VGTGDLYAVLGVSPEATQAEIKRAYFRKVREHPPETDPDGFQRISQAYEVLRDAERREGHDALSRYGDVVASLIAEADQCSERGDWQRAANAMRQAAVLLPHVTAIREKLGDIYVRAGMWEDAVRIFKGLADQAPHDADARLLVGNLLAAWASQFPTSSPRRRELKQQARQAFRSVLDIEATHFDAYLAIAADCAEEKQYTEAIEWAERAINCQPSSTAGDVLALAFIAATHAAQAQVGAVRSAVERMKQLAARSNEAERIYIAGQAFDCGCTCVRIAEFECAAELFRGATSCAPDGSEAKEVSRDLAECTRQMAIMISDISMPPALKQLCAVILLRHCSDEDDEQDELLPDALDGVAQLPAHVAREGIRRMQERSPALHKLCDPVLTHVAGAMGWEQPGSYVDSYAPSVPSSSSGEGKSSEVDDSSAVVVGAVIGGIVGSIIPGLGTCAGIIVGGFIGGWLARQQ